MKKQLVATRGLLPALAFGFALTFTVFPGVYQDTDFNFMNGWQEEESYFVLTTLTLFNVFDTMGRYSASVSCLQVNRVMTLVLSYARLIFVLTIMLTAFEVGPSWLFVSDWFKIVNMSAFAYTNGWLSSLCIILAPGCVADSEKGNVGSLISPMILGGILLGTVLALPMK